MKVSQDEAACREFPDVRRVYLEPRHEILTATPDRIGSGGNSGFQAINLAVNFGARKIVLVGYDMTVDRGVHWHGLHPRGLNNPKKEETMDDWRGRLEAAATALGALGVAVVNASPMSKLAAYPKINLEDAL